MVWEFASHFLAFERFASSPHSFKYRPRFLTRIQLEKAPAYQSFLPVPRSGGEFGVDPNESELQVKKGKQSLRVAGYPIQQIDPFLKLYS